VLHCTCPFNTAVRPKHNNVPSVRSTDQFYRPASLRHRRRLQRDGADLLSNINAGHADILRVADVIDSRE